MFSEMHHVAIIASDYQRAKSFYVDKLGFKVIREHHRPEKKRYQIDFGIVFFETKGITCEPIRFDSFTNKKMTFFQDPDGLPLELHE